MHFHPHSSGSCEQRASVVQQRIRARPRLLFRIGGWLLALVILVGGLLGPGSALSVHAAASKLLDYDPIGTYPAPTFVQHDPKVYLVFWGPKWSQDTSTISQIEQTFQALAGSQYNNIVTQYTDTPTSTDESIPSPSDLENGNYVHNDVELMTGPGAPFGRVIDTSSPSGGIDIGVESPTGVLWGAQIRNEADKEIAAQKWSVNPNSQIIVFPQEGTTYNSLSQPQQWCGMHVFNTTAPNHYAYALVQYGDQNSSCGTSAADIAFTAVHEYAEAATDPVIAFDTQGLQIIGSGWNTQSSSSFSPQEVADLCNNLSSYSPVNGNGSSFEVPSLWSNANNTCMTSIGKEFASPDNAYPFHGIHTVQGLILNAYNAAGANASVLGSPVTEEAPIAGGRVSYFNGGCSGSSKCVGIYWKSGLPVAYWVRSAIFQEYHGLGEAASAIGFPVSEDVAMNGGSVQYFDGTCAITTTCAGIYWSGSSGAHYVRGAEFNEYKAVGQAASVIGFPVSDDAAMNGGSVTYFNGTCGGANKCAGIYWSGGSGVHYVRGAEYQEYAAVGEANSVIGFPVTDDTTIGNGSVTYFNGTCGGTNKCAGIYWSSGTGAHYVRGAEYQKYVAVGEVSHVLGFPLTDDTSVAGGSATYFTANYACGTPGPSGSDGAIYWSGSTGAYEVHGCIYATYLKSFGGPGGVLGFPVSDEHNITAIGGNGGYVNYFAGGNCGSPGPYNSNSALYWTGSAGYEVQGCIYAKYVQIGGPAGVLGFPVSNEYTNSAGYRESDFEYGTIVWKNGVAVVYNGCKVSATVYTC